jgi:N-acetylmuramoyl-L-alanine amidase
MRKILLDAGHGGFDSGATNKNIYEADLNLKIVLNCGAILERFNCEVFYTRKEDIFISLSKRLELIKEYKPNCFVSFHTNAIEDDALTLIDERKKVSGTEIYYRDDGDLQLADAIQKLFIRSGFWFKNRAPAKDIERLNKKLTVLNDISIPCVLVELGYLTNSGDLEKLKNYNHHISDLVSHGILNYLREREENHEQ